MSNDLTPELVRRALDGDPGAQNLLVERLTPEIQFNVAKMLRQWRIGSASGRDLGQEVKDHVQRTFVELWKNEARALRRWDPKVLPLTAYVGYIAKLCTAQDLRSPRSQWREEPGQVEDLDRNDRQASPETKSSIRDLLQKVYLCLKASFTPVDFLRFELLIEQELSTKEVAETTDATPDAIYKWRSRLYQSAKNCLDQLSKAGS